MRRFFACMILELFSSFFSILFAKRNFNIQNDTQYDFFAGFGGPVRVPGFYEKNETRQFYSKLGELCQWSDNCFTAYAACDNTRCACSAGFQEKNSICVPRTVYCADPRGGDAPLAITAPKFCHIEQLNGTTIKHIGCSSSDEFCFIHPISRTSARDLYPSGHCCPMLTSATKLTSPVCPVVLQNKVFGDGNKNCEKCDSTMEECVSFKIWNTEMSYTYVGRCCPMACRDAVHTNQQLINLDGHCFYHRKYVKNNCDYTGRDIQLKNKGILRLVGLNSYECEYACLRYIQFQTEQHMDL